MWSLTSLRAKGTSGPENFQSSAKKDFFNTIRQKRSDPSRTLIDVCLQLSAPSRVFSSLDPVARLLQVHGYVDFEVAAAWSIPARCSILRSASNVTARSSLERSFKR